MIARTSRGPQLRRSALRKIDERTGNVYENKQQVQQVMAGADVAFERLRCVEGGSPSGQLGLSLRDIADPKSRGLRQPVHLEK